MADSFTNKYLERKRQLTGNSTVTKRTTVPSKNTSSNNHAEGEAVSSSGQGRSSGTSGSSRSGSSDSFTSGYLRRKQELSRPSIAQIDPFDLPQFDSSILPDVSTPNKKASQTSPSRVQQAIQERNYSPLDRANDIIQGALRQWAGGIGSAVGNVLDRTTSGTGWVKDYTLAELKTLRADNHMPGFADARIPTLQEVLDLIRPTGLRVNIELKTSILWYAGIEQKTLELVQAMGMQDRVIYSSFNHYSIEKVRELAPEAETAYLYSDIICDVEKYAAAHGVRGLHPGLWNVKMGDLLQVYLNSGLAVRVWTVNHAEDLRWLMGAGADVITNDPKLALEIRGSL